jgi:hypothetical protein
MSELDMQQRDRRLQEIGNLTLVTGKVNKLLTNHPWTQEQAVAVDAPVPRQNSIRGKRNVLAQYSTFLMNADLYTQYQETWNEEMIVRRGKEMINRILRIWPRHDPDGDEPTWNPPQPGYDPPREQPPTGNPPQPGARRSLNNLREGTEVYFRSIKGVVRGGKLLVQGSLYATPSAASLAVAGGVQSNGWRVWKTTGGKSLADLHDHDRHEGVTI